MFFHDDSIAIVKLLKFFLKNYLSLESADDTRGIVISVSLLQIRMTYFVYNVWISTQGSMPHVNH